MMATKSKDSGTTSNNVGKREKVVTKKTSNSHTKTNPSNKPTTTTSSTFLKSSSASTPTEKPLPNYLKPTQSSLQDPASSAAAGPKPTLNRRRSFNNKAPPSRAQKPQPERAAQQPALSSSFSRAPRGAGGTRPPSQLKAGKKGSGEVFVRKESPGVVSVVVADHGDDEDDDQVVKTVEDHDHHHDEVKVDEAKAPQDIATVSEELVVNPDGGGDHDHYDLDHNNSNVGVEEDHNEHNKVLESSEVGEEESHIDNDNDANSKDIVGSEDAIGVVEELVRVEEKEETSEGQLGIINKASSDGDYGDGATNAKELGEDDIEHVVCVVVDGDNNNDIGGENEDESGKKSEEAKSPSSSSEKKAQGSGKKEAQIAYNDVIEETASKLLEKRKNKVKALVGAFETVIDYESAAK